MRPFLPIQRVGRRSSRERERTLFPRMPSCSSKTFQIVGRIRLFLAPLPRGKQNYNTIPLLPPFENGPRLIRRDTFVLLLLLLLLFSLCSLYAQRSLSRRQVSRRNYWRAFRPTAVTWRCYLPTRRCVNATTFYEGRLDRGESIPALLSARRGEARISVSALRENRRRKKGRKEGKKEKTIVKTFR